MKRPLALLAVIAAALALGGCLTSPVASSGGPGSITIPNTTPAAIRTAALAVFPRYGYTAGRSNFPESLTFDRPAGRFGELMFGGPGQSTSMRARLQLTPIAGTTDIRITTQVFRVNNADRPGFERETPMLLRSWASQFNAILREIRDQAADARSGRPRP